MSSAAQTPRRTRSFIAGVTSSDRATASLIGVCFVLGTALLYLVAVWISNLLPSRTIAAAPLQIVDEEGFGGDPEGSPDESLLIESPEPESPDAAKGEDFAEVAEVPDVAMVDSVADLANDIDQAVDADPNGEGPAFVRSYQPAPLEVRKPGSSSGTGSKKPLGEGPGGKGGVPREMRWFVKFSERGTLDDYAAQLDFFGIELGALLPDGKLVLISKFTGARPASRIVNSGADEKRLYFTWRGAGRKAGDLELFQKAGTNASNATMILHFYPPQTENQLARLELQHKNRKAIEIKRTYFVVRRAKDGYEFAVSSQTYLR